MAGDPNCARCGAPLRAAGAECPRCLLGLGLHLPSRDPAHVSEVRATAGATTGDGGKSRARAASTPSPEEIGARFPQLQVLELLGRGGMGLVYKARQPRLDRFVALKVLPPETSDREDFAERFLREARLMARLRHPHIVGVYDFGETDGLCWLIMEYVDGANLRQLMETGGLSPPRALALVPQICEALQYAHDEGVVHRDIKPDNVLVDTTGQVKIADFGLAKLLGDVPDLALTGPAQVMGTLHYMAPEQLQGARDVDHRADIYSLGVVFYEMLTGQLPLGRFEAPSRRVAVDVRLDEIVLRALEQAPERRYQHAAEVGTDVEIVRGTPAGTAPPAAEGAPRLDVGADTGRAARPVGWFASAWRRRMLVDGGTLLVAVGWVTWGELAAHGAPGAMLGLAVLVGAVLLADGWRSLARATAGKSAIPLASIARRWAAVPALGVGLTMLGIAVHQWWEQGVSHYVPPGRLADSEALETSFEEAFGGAELDDRLAGVTIESLSGDSWSVPLESASSLALALTGILLLAAAGLALHWRAGPHDSWGLGWLRALALPAQALTGAFVVAGLVYALQWSDWAPPRTAVTRSATLAAPLSALRAELLSGLAAAGQLVDERVDAVLPATGDDEARTVGLLVRTVPANSLEAWSFGLMGPRRVHPRLVVRLVEAADGASCRLDWDAGSVREYGVERMTWERGFETLLARLSSREPR